MGLSAFNRMRERQAAAASSQAEKQQLENLSVEELKQYAEANQVNIGAATSQAGILKKIKEAKVDDANG